MKKDRNSRQPVQNGDFSLPRKKILRGRKNFQRLFTRDAHISCARHVGLRYRIVDSTTCGCLIGFIVKKSLGKAHKRNTMKRLLREAYRLHQHILTDSLQQVRQRLHGALIAYTTDVAFKDIEQDVIVLLERARDKLPTA